MTTKCLYLASSPGSSQQTPRWRDSNGASTSRRLPQWLGGSYQTDTVQAPIDYFRSFFDTTIIDHIVSQSNLYAAQKDPSKPLGLTACEFEKFLSVILLMAIIPILNSRSFWSLDLRIIQVSDILSRRRFEEIKRFVHFNDNSFMLPPDHENFDKLFKVRPFLDHLRRKYNSIAMPQTLCVDEQMIPFKGKSSLKQYMPGKPHKYGYKVFMLCSNKGIIHDFEIYSGKIQPLAGEPDLGASSNIVVRLAQVIPSGRNHLLFFDNWFSSLPLMCHLAELKIFCLGTVRSNRLRGCILPSDKDIKKKGRGSYKEKQCKINNTTLRAIKWMDTKPVTLLTSFDSAHPLTSVSRYDPKTNRRIDVTCPNAIVTYNTNMGGVDLLDALIAFYRIKLRSKKYYHRLFFHFTDMTVVTSWLLYRRDCEEMGVPRRKQLPLLKFKYQIADALHKQGKAVRPAKRGRPSSSVELTYEAKRARGYNSKPIPQQGIRQDNMDHFPIYKEKRSRCKLPGCKSSPHLFYHKCEVYLCIDKNKNCFWKFHKN